ncbi:unnamed protein product [Linum tenue]|uniref:CCHC-type domain-containing protein n=1 Tax=Linum tenue TaxID=586396 RepID=A0AAV0JXW1_9ROSI|nr:unnamed protein product [Linum tenue]
MLSEAHPVISFSTPAAGQAGRPPDVNTLPDSTTDIPAKTMAPAALTVTPRSNPSNSPPLNYKAALSGQGRDSRTTANRWTFVGEQDLVAGSFAGEPELKISDNFKERLCDPWKKTLVIRLLGRSVSYNYLCSQLRWKWRPTGSIDIMDLNNETFLVTFSNDQDYLKALTGGPWEILDHYLVVHPWSPKFRTSDKIHKSVTAWVQLPELPVHFYHREVLFALGNLIGRTVKLDYHTEMLERGKFARIAVELDMSKPLPTRIRLDGFWQQVLYENIPQICFDCGRIGHTEETCPTKLKSASAELGSEVIPHPANVGGNIDSPAEPPAGYGPWMQVMRKSRKPIRKASDSQGPQKGNQQEKLANQGKQTAKILGSSKGANPGNIGANDGKGKGNHKPDSKKGKSDTQKGKVSTEEGKNTQKGKVTAEEGKTMQANRKANNDQREWIPVGAAKGSVNGPSLAIKTGPLTPSPLTAGHIEQDLGNKCGSPSVGRASPTTLPKENLDPNVHSHSVRQHFDRRNASNSPGSGKIDRHLKIAKKQIHNPAGTKREMHQLVQANTFPITQRDIESFLRQSKQKAEEFGISSTTLADDIRMEDSNFYADFTIPDASTLNRLASAPSVEEIISIIKNMGSLKAPVLPYSVCDMIDKKIRGFVWGRENGKEKAHLVTWETVCKPKEEGGLGLRSARALNLAYLMKLGWQFLNNEESLWVRVLHGKYVKQNDDGSVTFRQQGASRLWKGIKDALPLVKQNTIWDIRDGRSVNFWKDHWISNGLALKDHVVSNGHTVEWDNSVAEMVNSSGTDTPLQEAGEDTTIWGPESDGRFRIGSAYRAAVEWLQDADQEEAARDNHTKWMHGWKWPGPNRIRYFLWLCFHDRLMTNGERKRRKLCDSDTCEICKSGAETAEHVIRTCPLATQVWNSLGLIETPLTHCLNFAGWMATNLKKEGTNLLFGVAAWFLWRRRNDWIFEKRFQESDTLAHRIRAWVAAIKQAQDNNQKLRNDTEVDKTRQELAWQPPPEDWIVINSDGSVKQPNSAAAAGGLLRNHLGRCVGAFVTNLGSCSITRAEIIGALTGLQLAWDLGYKKVLLRLDSTAALDILTGKDQDSRRYHNLYRHFQNLLQRNWEDLGDGENDLGACKEWG